MILNFEYKEKSISKPDMRNMGIFSSELFEPDPLTWVCSHALSQVHRKAASAP